MRSLGARRRGVAIAALVMAVGCGQAIGGDVAECRATTERETALAACTRVVDGGEASGEDLVFARIRRAMALSSMDRLEDAIRDLDGAIALQPRHAEALGNRGALYMTLGDFDRALADMDAALAIEPRHAIALFNRSILHSKRGEFEAARRDIDLSLDINPSWLPANAQRCWIEAIIATDLPKAAAACEIALEMGPEIGNVHNNNGFLNYRMRRYEIAISAYDRAIALDPAMGSSYYMRGMSKRAAGRDGDADIAKGLELEPGLVERYARYGVPKPK